MKRSLPLLAALAFPSLTLAQGDLTPPPGGPAPSMKTLQQVEPRIDLFKAPANLVSTDDRSIAAALLICCVASMTIGNLAAMKQRDLKRLIAYSTVAHAGYIEKPDVYNRLLRDFLGD